jgi:hypothetical protein
VPVTNPITRLTPRREQAIAGVRYGEHRDEVVESVVAHLDFEDIPKPPG